MKLGREADKHQQENSGAAVNVGSFLRGTQREYSSKPLKHSIVKRILVFKGEI